MSTRVVSIHREAHTVSIMRGYGRKWGNPARLASRDPLDVVACLLAHARHLEESGLIDNVRELRGEVLGCVCKPARCHGDTLARCADADDARAELQHIIEELEAEYSRIHDERHAQQDMFGGSAP